jgi:hypothetical protein
MPATIPLDPRTTQAAPRSPSSAKDASAGVSASERETGELLYALNGLTQEEKAALKRSEYVNYLKSDSDLRRLPSP